MGRPFSKQSGGRGGPKGPQSRQAASTQPRRGPTKPKGADWEEHEGPVHTTLQDIAAKYGMLQKGPPKLQRMPASSRRDPVDRRAIAMDLPPPMPAGTANGPGASRTALNTPAKPMLKAVPSADPRALVDLVRSKGGVPELLSLYMNHRQQFDAVTGAVVLARVAAVRGLSAQDDALLRKETAFTTLLNDLLNRLNKSLTSAAGQGADDAVPAARDARVLSSILHACGKIRDALPPPRAVGSGETSSLALRDLAQTVLELLSPQLHTAPPRALAMAAWGASRLGVTDKLFYDAVWSAATTGEASLAPAWLPTEVTAKMSARDKEMHRMGRGTSVSKSVASCPFDPVDLSMLVSAVGSAHSHALERAKGQAEAPGQGQPGIGLGKVLDGLAPWVVAARPHAPHKALASMAWAYAASGSTAGTQAESAVARPGSISRSEVQDRVLFTLSEELALRLGLAQIDAERSRGAPGAEVAGLEAALLTSRGQADMLAVSTEARKAQLQPDTAVNMLRALVSAGMQPAPVLRAMARWLATPVMATPAAGVAGGSNSAPQPVASSLSSESLANAAWCMARARYEDADTPRLWLSLLAAAHNGLTLARQGGLGPQAAHGVRSAHLATLAWAFSTANVPAQAFVSEVLQLAADRPAALSVPSLCQLVWAGALQRVVGPSTLGPVLEHVLDVAGEKAAMVRSAMAVGSADEPARMPRLSSSSDPDVLAAELLEPKPRTPGVARMQAQLRTAVAAMQWEPSSGSSASHIGNTATSATVEEVVATVPDRALAAWTAALARHEEKAAKLTASIVRVLDSVGLPCSTSHISPAGVPVDVWVSPERAQAAAPGAGQSSDTWTKQYPRGVAIQFVSPLAHSKAVQGFHSVALQPGGRVDAGSTMREGDATPDLPSSGLRELDLQQLEDAVRRKAGTQALNARAGGTSPSAGLGLQGAGIGVGQGRAAMAAAGITEHSEASDELQPLPGVSFEQLSTLGRSLVPSLRTQATHSWLSSLGYRVVPVPFYEWEAAVSTQEKAELLAEKGVPIHRKHLSY